MDVAAGDMGGMNEKIVGQLEVAGNIGGRDAALVHPEDMDLLPGEAGPGELLEHELGRGTAG